MITISECSVTQYNEQSNINWQDIYATLRPLAKHIAYTYSVPAWHGQENDIAEDIIQETARKLFEYGQKIKCGGAQPIQTLQPMVRAIACNYGKDLRRHDIRQTRIEAQDEDILYFRNEEINIEEDVIENVYHEMLFRKIACEIARFPYKQRQALLIDLATHMSFEQQPTPLQKAFLKVGISLQSYQNLLPTTLKEQNRHTSLLAHAYKRISTLSCARIYAEHNT